jgi:diazepam-binding inhibitor (GABA receptor modulating acyl-CoA-binding protein)
MANSSQFITASNIITSLNETPSNDELGQLYGLYKQATVGNNTTPKPNIFEFKANKKWSSWFECNGLSTYNAEVKYINLVNILISKYGIKQ